VADLLTIEVRRLETKLGDLIKKAEAANSEATKAATAPVTQTEKKAYDFQLKTYCKFFIKDVRHSHKIRPYSKHFISLVLYVRLERLGRDKHFRLLVPFVSPLLNM
jgi:hypothetical protein